MKANRICLTIFILFTVIQVFYGKQRPEIHQKLRIGTTIGVFGGLKGLTYENLEKAKKAGVDYVEITLTGYVNGDNPIPDLELKEIFKMVKKDADAAGIQIWSIHMPYGPDCDPSHTDEEIRLKTINFYLNNLNVVSELKPNVILFHPSWRLGLNERQERIAQFAKSAVVLNNAVKKIGAIMVVENLLGFELLRNEKTERPLGRTVEEMIEIMSVVPADVYAAIDMNHIKQPERLINALGNRIRSVHICDGNGEKECHYLPGKGDNNWNLILHALDKAAYEGPFMYEIRGNEIKTFEELKSCYDSLYNDYNAYLDKIRPFGN
jgi:hexosaminidase